LTSHSATYAWAKLLVGTLQQAGASEVVICPGSRSTPLAWAALTASRLNAHSLVDERSAAYFALGQAKATGRPTAVICTSGTAAANCLPAAVEATASRTPLLLITADRPPELQQCGANQTIDQTRLFGAHCRHFVDLGLPDGSPVALRALQRKMAQAVHEARWPVGGAVHVNAPFRKPLEPPLASSIDATVREADALLARGSIRIRPPDSQPCPVGVTEIADACRGAHHGLLSCGGLDPWQALDPQVLVEFLRVTDFSLVCDAGSQVRFALPEELRSTTCDGFDLALRSAAFRGQAAVDVVVHVGAPRVSIQWEAFLRAQPDVRQLVITPGGWPDPSHTAHVLMVADPNLALSAISDQVQTRPSPPSEPAADARRAWRARLMEANDVVWQVADARPSDGVLSETVAIRAVIDAAPAGSVLALGNSLPIREADLVCRASNRELAVWSQRGASGIDGVLSSAAGSAQAFGRPTTLLVGDVSFLHDLGGLWAARRLAVPFVIVVLNNDGGRIFEHLPLAEVASANPEVFDYWLTPHGLDLTQAAALFRCPAERPADVAGIRAALARGHARPGPTLVEIRVPSSSARAELGLISRQVEDQLAALCGRWRAVFPGDPTP